MQQSDKQTNEQKLSQLMDGEWHELNASECVAALCADEALKAKWSRFHMIRDIMKNEPVAAEHGLASRICAAIDDEPSYSNITPFNTASAATTSHAAVPETGHKAGQVDELAAESFVVDKSISKSADSTVSHIDTRKRSVGSDSMFKTGLTGFALAASVALVTVVGMNIWQSQGTDQTSSIATALPQTVINGTNVFSQQSDGGSLPVVEFVSNTGSYWVSPETTERVGDEQRLNMLLSQHIENSPTSDREGLLPYSRLVGYDEISVER